MKKNIIIIGAGPAGEAAAKTLRRLEKTASITLIEREQTGGLCLNKGCIPSKTLLEHVHQRAAMNRPIDWGELQSFKDKVVIGIRSQLETSLKNMKINLVKGEASFSGPTSIGISFSKRIETISFDDAVIAVGTEPLFPPPFDRYRNELKDSDKMLHITSTPRSLIVVGGGAVGCEFACLLNAAGCDVTIVELTNNLLPGEDEAVAAALSRSFESRGLKIRTGVTTTELKKTGTGWEMKLSNGDSLSSEEILVCVGRVPSFQSLNLDKAGVKFEKNIIVNDKFQTSNPHVYAVGDVTGTRLAHAAEAQAEAAAHNILGESKIFDGRFAPRCLYSWPEVASVGRWKYELEKENKPVKTVRAFFQGSAKALAAGETEGFAQIVLDPLNGKILGAQIIGPHATELIHVFSVALKKDMTVCELGEVIFAHPTLSEIIKEAARK